MILVAGIASAFPAVALGLAFGIWLRPHVQAELFRALVVAVLILSSLVVLASTIRESG